MNIYTYKVIWSPVDEEFTALFDNFKVQVSSPSIETLVNEDIPAAIKFLQTAESDLEC